MAANDGNSYSTLLLEAARTNLISDDNLDNWTKSNTPVITSGQDDPAGGTGAYTVEDDDGANVEFIYLAVTYTGDGVKTVVFVIAENTMPAAGEQRLFVVDTTAPANRLQADITAWSDGEPTITMTTGTEVFRRELLNSYWAVYFQTTAVVAANANRVEIVPAATAAQTGSIDVYRANTFDATVPPQSILDAGVTKAADHLYHAYLALPQAMTAYVSFVEGGTALLSGLRIAVVGIDGGAAGNRLDILADNDRYRALCVNGGSSSDSLMGAATAPDLGDFVELRVTVSATGVCQIHQSINGATEVAGVAGGAAGVPGTWQGERLVLNSLGDGTQAGVNAFVAHKIAPGVRTLSEMRALL
jgi:hypothetical protein